MKLKKKKSDSFHSQFFQGHLKVIIYHGDYWLLLKNKWTNYG